MKEMQLHTELFRFFKIDIATVLITPLYKSSISRLNSCPLLAAFCCACQIHTNWSRVLVTNAHTLVLMMSKTVCRLCAGQPEMRGGSIQRSPPYEMSFMIKREFAVFRIDQEHGLKNRTPHQQTSHTPAHFMYSRLVSEPKLNFTVDSSQWSSVPQMMRQGLRKSGQILFYVGAL